MNFGVGQKVVAISGECTPDWHGDLPKLGVVYTVLWVVVDGDDEMIDLVELPSPEIGPFARGYMAKCFRPVVERKTDISFAHEILRKATKRAPATPVALHHLGTEP
jgi:hypothetical protein